MRTRSYSGFTLIELSIVLVIIGLIVGGVLVGRDLVKAAELRSVISDMNQFKIAVNVFRMKYSQLPGDITGADGLWPSCVVSPYDPGNVCNGNGDGRIRPWSTEGIRAWQHLSLSGILPGGYSGIDDGIDNNLTPGVNTPTSRVPNAGYMFLYENNTVVYGRQSNSIYLGAEQGNGSLANPVLSPFDAATIDQKGDDGRADGGDIFARNGSPYDKTTPGACVNGDPADASASYIITNTDISCRLIFWLTR